MIPRMTHSFRATGVWFGVGVLLGLGLRVATAQDATAAAPQTATATTNLPRVLLIGDSISLGYTPHVVEALKGEFDVDRVRGNGRDSAHGLARIDDWLDQGAWDIIHFNWGLWDLCYRNPESNNQGKRDKVDGTITATPDAYADNLRKIVRRMREKSDALLIWCSTTPVPEGEAGRKAGDELVYNEIAATIVREHGVRVHDLHAAATPIHAEHASKPGDVHYTDKGSALLAESVCRAIRGVWNPPLPRRVDNSDRPAFPPVLAQRFGDCAQQNGISYILTYELNVARRRAGHRPENRFDGHFAYQFVNRGRDTGSEIVDGWSIGREMGFPSDRDWEIPEAYAWPSGHRIYERALANRVEDVHFFRVVDTNQLQQARRWLFNRGDPRRAEGGLLAYDQRFAGRRLGKVPAGRYEAGKTVILDFDAIRAGHFMTAVGYDDEVGIDFDGDGRVTNDKDITGDGKVTLADWERGAFIIVNSHGPKFGDRGKAYIPYRIQATTDWDRGRWLAGVTVKARHEPKLVLRLKFATSDRSQLRVRLRAESTNGASAVWEPLLFSERRAPVGEPESPEAFGALCKGHRHCLGALPPRGKENDEPIEMSFEVTGIDLAAAADCRLEVRLKDAGAGGQLLAASLFWPGTKTERPFAIADGDLAEPRELILAD